MSDLESKVNSQYATICDLNDKLNTFLNKQKDYSDRNLFNRMSIDVLNMSNRLDDFMLELLENDDKTLKHLLNTQGYENIKDIANLLVSLRSRMCESDKLLKVKQFQDRLKNEEKK